MVSLADAKAHLGLNDDEADVRVGQLISAATGYLQQIGVQVEPEPGPVGEAVLLLVSIFFRRNQDGHRTKADEVADVGTISYFDPKLIDEADMRVVTMLIQPYREVHL